VIFASVLALALQTVSPSQTVAKDVIGTVEEPVQTVARTPAEFATLWKGPNGSQPTPKVDFGSRMAVAVFLGTREAAGVLTVEWRERRPDPGAMAAQLLTSPCHVATVPRFVGEVRLQKVDQ